MTVKEITDHYIDLGGKIFGDKRTWWNPIETFKYLKAMYDYEPLEENLKKVFGEDTLLGSSKIKTGLCIVAKRADTNSTWPLINHPKARYYSSNGNIPLWQAVRASTAAPTYFAPQMIDIGAGQIAAFVDGGLSMSNNPALTLLMVATLKGFPFHWKMSKQNLSLVSIGTGYSIYEKQTGDIKNAWLKTWASNAPNMLMQDASWQNQIILQWLSKSPTAVVIDREIGDLKKDLIGGEELLKYLRYNYPFTQNDLNALQMGKSFSEKRVKDLMEMSHAKNRKALLRIGEKVAEKIVSERHFRGL